MFGLTLIEILHSLLSSPAITSTRINSASLSTLIIKISNSIASLISQSLLPTPENMILYDLIPTLKARLTSPIDTQSAPAPKLPRC